MLHLLRTCAPLSSLNVCVAGPASSTIATQSATPAPAPAPVEDEDEDEVREKYFNNFDNFERRWKLSAKHPVALFNVTLLPLRDTRLNVPS